MANLFDIGAQQGGGQQLFDMVQSGQISQQDILNSGISQQQIDSWLANNQPQAQPSTPPANAGGPQVGTAQNPLSGPHQPYDIVNGPAPNNGINAPTYNPGNAGNYLNQNTNAGQNLQTYSNNDQSYPTDIPQQPEYWQAAQAQGTENLEAAKKSVALQNPDVNNPFGSQSVSIGPDGRPVVNQSFSAPEQQRYDQLNSILPSVFNNIQQNTGKSLGDYEFSKVTSPDQLFGNLPGRSVQGGVQGQSAVADALRQREQPRLDRNREATKNQLLMQGLNPGSEAWNAAMDDVSRSENDFNLGLTALSGQEQSRLFNIDQGLRSSALSEAQALFDAQTGNRGREIGEQITARTLPIQEYGSLVQAMTPNLPQFPTYQGASVEAAPYFNAINAQGLFDLGRYGTSIQGELGTRGLDASIRQGYVGAMSDLIGSGLSYYGA